MGVYSGSGDNGIMSGILLKYLAVIVLVLLSWWIWRSVNPIVFTVVGLLIIAGSTAWLVIGLARQPIDPGKKIKSWWRTIWDGFWGL